MVIHVILGQLGVVSNIGPGTVLVFVTVNSDFWFWVQELVAELIRQYVQTNLSPVVFDIFTGTVFADNPTTLR